VNSLLCWLILSLPALANGSAVISFFASNRIHPDGERSFSLGPHKAVTRLNDPAFRIDADHIFSMMERAGKEAFRVCCPMPKAGEVEQFFTGRKKLCNFGLDPERFDPMTKVVIKEFANHGDRKRSNLNRNDGAISLSAKMDRTIPDHTGGPRLVFHRCQFGSLGFRHGATVAQQHGPRNAIAALPESPYRKPAGRTNV
jgi:hypothetical protein